MGDWWTGYPWRLIQTNLREIDMLDIDAERLVAGLKEFAATVILLNTAGIIASYPTRLPFHFQSPYLQGDSLADIIRACHREGIRVLARTDFSKVRRPIYEAHPEWAYVSPRGEIADYNGDVHVCVNGDYQQEYALRIIEEVLSTLDVDGIFFNMGGYQVRDYSGNYHGICHCESCRRRFADLFGLPLPAAEDMDDPVFRKYRLFRRQTLREHQEKVHTLIRRLRPDLCIANHLELRRGVIRQEANTAIDRPLPHWQYSASANTKWAVSSYPEMVSSNATVDFVDYPYRHVAVSPHEQELRLAQNLANGGGLDYYLIGRLDNHEDRCGFARIKALFAYHAGHEEEYAGLASKATVALLHGPDADENEYRGWYRFLVENHFLFDTLMVEAAQELPWDRYQAVIIPNYQPIGDDLAGALDAFAQDGGIVIAVSHSGFRGDDYELRATPALRCLGIERVAAVRTGMRSSYFKLDSKAGFDRFADTDLVYMDGDYVYAEYAANVEKRLRLIPPHMYGPPERCYYTVTSEHPGFTINPFGGGRGVYIPWRPGALFHRQGHTNTCNLAGDLLQNVLGVQPLSGSLSPMVEATLFERSDGSYQLLHLVNGSGHFGVTYYEPVTMTGVEVTLPCRRAPVAVRSLLTGQACEFAGHHGSLTIRVPRLGLFDAIKITLLDQ